MEAAHNKWGLGLMAGLHGVAMRMASRVLCFNNVLYRPLVAAFPTYTALNPFIKHLPFAQRIFYSWQFNNCIPIEPSLISSHHSLPPPPSSCVLSTFLPHCLLFHVPLLWLIHSLPLHVQLLVSCSVTSVASVRIASFSTSGGTLWRASQAWPSSSQQNVCRRAATLA